MKIILTGQNGFIGQNIYKKLISDKDQVSLIDLRQENYNLEYTDYELLIHCASSTPDNTVDEKTILEKNISILNKICKVIDSKNINKIINLSSMSIYGRAASGYIDEKMTSKEPDIYGLSKIYIESYLNLRYQEKLDILHLRLPGVTGKVENNIFLNKLYNKIKVGESIEVDSSNVLFNNILDIDDLVNYINQNKCTNRLKNKTQIALNLGSKNPITLNTVIDLFYEKLNKRKNIKITNNLRSHFYINIEKAEKHGFKPLLTENAILKFISMKEIK